MSKTVRLILGDQLNINHSWYSEVDADVRYVLMEVVPESEYVTHHIQKIVGIFSAMRIFAERLSQLGHDVKYYRINDGDNEQSFVKNISTQLREFSATRFEYQEPDEYRLDEQLSQIGDSLGVDSSSCSTEHFYTDRDELATMFEGKKAYLMESFYRQMRKKHNVLMGSDGKPTTGKWNYDHENRKKLPKHHEPTEPKVYHHDVTEVMDDIKAAGLSYIGQLSPSAFIWPLTREEALELYDFFLQGMLQYFGAYQDSMAQHHWSIYHSRISFALNIKLISPAEVVTAAEEYWSQHQEAVSIAQVEGFIRQILGWREYMRGIYWAHMPDYESLNHFTHTAKLPSWYWTGETDMNCLSQSIGQSLEHAYAHHIQRLMITGNFALLAGIHPDEVDAWYLGIYIDAFQWVEITNTRGMSQYADGGIVGTKPYVSSGSYIHKMGDYCSHCKYDVKKKTGEGACPFNSMYWNFLDRHRELLASNPRMSMMYRVWDKYDGATQTALLEQAATYLEQIEQL